MAFHASPFGMIQLPEQRDARPPRHRPDGVRVVRRPGAPRPEAKP